MGMGDNEEAKNNTTRTKGDGTGGTLYVPPPAQHMETPLVYRTMYARADDAAGRCGTRAEMPRRGPLGLPRGEAGLASPRSEKNNGLLTQPS